MFSKAKQKISKVPSQSPEPLRMGTLQNVLEETKEEGSTLSKKSGRTETVPFEEIPRILKRVYGKKDPDQEAQERLVRALTAMLENPKVSYEENEEEQEN
jgi:hypothetical protein